MIYFLVPFASNNFVTASEDPPEYTFPSSTGPVLLPILTFPVLRSICRRGVPSAKNFGLRESTMIRSKYDFQSRWGVPGLF